MTKEEIKKELYKQKPIAKKVTTYINPPNCDSDFTSYHTYLKDNTLVIFDVMHNEFEDISKLEEKMPAQLLIRWMI